MSPTKRKEIDETGDVASAEKLSAAREKIVSQLGRIIVGQDNAIEELLIALFAGGHCLLVGVPGLAKTLMLSSLAKILDLEFSRIQFTPDLMPSDITGSDILQEDPNTRERVFKFVPGPVFSNLVLADEINRTPPKTQSALLQAMQEKQVTAGGETRSLPLPFFVMATQNPIEHEGTFPLPEAQLDRFFLQIAIDYPSESDERKIVFATTGAEEVALGKVLSADEVLALQAVVRKVPVPPSVVDFAVRLARDTRPVDGAPDFVKKWVSWGAGPRASQALILGAKARALLSGRFAVSEEDVRRIAKPILRHRVVLAFQAEAEGVSVDGVIDRLLEPR
ncbi:MAG: AAA family ATPase [Elusimicrobia bacterium CG1_02_63_36]|nr:MAG: AAA family ATPase [Elusimicrobia bacterium CG1_02_63_36]PIP83493.1 MAG: AAA family ATPase [Elusimicrobia bacterium CG22_combo_CG10-13_8_21_14_all_63_91]PJA12339.1 MAG: AAA family ATPase [Elusimicrobia bacterium CG_4_10_14_0_2_um_filter_63_34]PJB24709.1 MAG: AAA family ATPase [Elusimicrobia bacterium CG_4_9_14_3_um_filter_62_55]